MKKNEQYSGLVTELKFPNKGIVIIEGEKVLIKNALVGQEIAFTLTKNRANKKEGRLDQVIQKAPEETEEPPCPHFETCGGCAYQTLSYEGQKNLKLKQVQDLFPNVYPDFPLVTCKESPKKWEYRNKMEFSFGDEFKNGPLTLGLHKRGSFYDIVPVTQCKIVDEDIRLLLSFTLEYFREKKMTYVHKRTHEGFLRHLMVRRSEKTGDILICLVTSSEAGCELQPWVEGLLSLPMTGKIVGMLQMINDSLADIVKADETITLYGQDYFYEELLDLNFKVTPFSFFQTNSLGAETLYKVARDYIGEIQNKVIFDLYSGTGTIAQVLAPIAKKVIGVEIVEEAVVAARENAILNGLTNCEFIAGDVLKVIDQIKDKPDFIVLDPPREGVHPKALKRIIEYGVDRLVYISCKPTSLAHDMEALLEGGYVPVKAECVDMFPWTRGVETVVLLSKQSSSD